MNIPLFSAIFAIASTVLMGVLIILVVVMDKLNATTMLASVAIGFLVSLPIAFVVSKKISKLSGSPDIAPK